MFQYNEEFDLIILDLMLPEVDGFDICRQVRQEKNTPIIMVSAKVKVINPQGMHMRPAQVFVAEMAKYNSDVTIVFGGKNVNAKSIMHLMAACIKQGSELEIRCEGEQEAEALKAAVALVEAGLGDL